MTGTVRIAPDGIYDDGSLYSALEISAQTLARARRNGTLRYTRKRQRVFYLGKWILDWLEIDARELDGESPTAGATDRPGR